MAEAAIRLLQGDNVRAKLLDHGGNAARVEAAVHADAAMDVVGGDDEALRGRVARRRRRRVPPGQRAFQHMQRAAHAFGQALTRGSTGWAWTHSGRIRRLQG